MFLARAGALVAAVAFPVACGGKKAATSTAETTGGQVVRVYLLSTSDGKCTGVACACGACGKHAANKLFATSEAADTGRAHTHCNCTIIEETLPADRWQTLFGDPARPDRLHVDRRDPRVAQALA